MFLKDQFIIYTNVLSEIGDAMKTNAGQIVEHTTIIEAEKDICTFISKNKTGNKKIEKETF